MSKKLFAVTGSKILLEAFQKTLFKETQNIRWEDDSREPIILLYPEGDDHLVVHEDGTLLNHNRQGMEDINVRRYHLPGNWPSALRAAKRADKVPAPPLPEICGHTPEVVDGKLKVGCHNVSKEWLDRVYKLARSMGGGGAVEELRFDEDGSVRVTSEEDGETVLSAEDLRKLHETMWGGEEVEVKEPRYFTHRRRAITGWAVYDRTRPGTSYRACGFAYVAGSGRRVRKDAEEVAERLNANDQ